jgi:hypothetical protein
MTLGVGKHLTLPPFHLFVSIHASFPTDFRRFHTLAVTNPHAWLGISAFFFSV